MPNDRIRLAIEALEKALPPILGATTALRRCSRCQFAWTGALEQHASTCTRPVIASALAALREPEPASGYLRGARDLAERLKARMPGEHTWATLEFVASIDAVLHEMIKEKE